MAPRALLIDYLLGHPVLDRDHRQIIALLSLLEDALALGDRDLARNIGATLLHKTASHFETEGRLFESMDFPKRQEHEKGHALTLERLDRLRRMMEDDVPSAELIEEIEAIGEIFARQLLPQDEEFTRFLKQREIRPPG